MDKLKDWVIDVLIKKMGPSAIRAGILGLVVLLAAHQEVLVQFGIVYDAAARVITINLDKMNLGLVFLLPAVGGAVIKMLNHHADTVARKVTGADGHDE